MSCRVETILHASLKPRKRSASVRIQKRIGNAWVPVMPRCKSNLPVAVLSRSSMNADSNIVGDIKCCLEEEGKEIVDLTFELDNFTQAERHQIGALIADNCLVLEHLRYKSLSPLPYLEHLSIPLLSQVKTLEFQLNDNDENVAYDAFILNHLRVCAHQLETLSFGTIDIGRCLRKTRCRSLTKLQAPLNEETYAFLELHSNLETIKIHGPYCDMERLQLYLPMIRYLYIGCHTIVNIKAISKLKHLLLLEINCPLPTQTYSELLSVLRLINMVTNIVVCGVVIA